jgi:hypothetical protein
MPEVGDPTSVLDFITQITALSKPSSVMVPTMASQSLTLI